MSKYFFNARLKSFAGVLALGVFLLGSHFPVHAADQQTPEHSTWHPDTAKPYVLLFLDTKSVLGKQSVFSMVTYNDPLHGAKGNRFTNLQIDGHPLTQKDSLIGEYDLSPQDTLPSSVEVSYEEFGVKKKTRVRLLTYALHLADTLSAKQIGAWVKSFQSSLKPDESMDLKFSPPVTSRNGAIQYYADVSISRMGISMHRGSLDSIPSGACEIAATVQSHTAHQSAVLPAVYCILMTGITKEAYIK